MNLVFFVDAVGARRAHLARHPPAARQRAARRRRRLGAAVAHAARGVHGGDGRLPDRDHEELRQASGATTSSACCSRRARRQARRLPLLRHADRQGVVPRGHQQHPQLGRGAQPLRPKDIDQILAADAPAGEGGGAPRQATRLYAHFVKRVRENMHIVLCMSPIGDAFRTPLPHVPGADQLLHDRLVLRVARGRAALGRQEVLRGRRPEDADEIKAGIVRHVRRKIHQSVLAGARKFFAEQRRNNYVTPTSYLELLNTYQALLGEKREEVRRRSRALLRAASTSSSTRTRSRSTS